MPRTGDEYELPYSPVVSGTPIESLEYNGTLADIATDLNTARPVVAGGSGASTVDGALDNLSAEKFKQVVTNWDATVWRAGSFYAATTAIGSAPVASHAFAGIVYYRNATDLVIEATDVTDPLNPQPWMRIQAAGVWGNWMMAPGSAPNKKNYIINGAMMVSQEYGTTGISGLSNVYPVDQFAVTYTGTTAVHGSAQAVASTPSGSPNRFRLALSTADATVGAGDLFIIYQALEGLRVADFKSGTADSKTITIQFGVKAPAGTYCVSVRNGATNRSYVAEYVITAGEANTDTVKSITLKLDTSGTWAINNTTGMYVQWCLMCGTTFQATAGTWVAGNFSGSANQFNFMGNLSNIFELFDVSLTEGPDAPPFVVPDYASDLALCQRYFYSGIPPAKGVVITAATVGRVGCIHPVPMRASPTLTMTTNLPVADGLAASTLSSISTPYATATVLEFDGAGASGLTVGRMAYVYQSGAGNLKVSARL